MTAPDAAAVWEVLVRSANARASELDDFVHHWPACGEYRFMGSLGFGGKVRWNRGRAYVDCYPEDETHERRATIERTNAALSRLTTGVHQ